MVTHGSVRRKSKEIFQKVIELRKKGFSYTEIRKETGVAKTTINNWLALAGLTLSKEHLAIQEKKRIENHVLGTIASKITRGKRKDEDIQGFINIQKANFDDPLFIAGIMLYEAEGSKGESNGFSNSDFRLIKLFIKFLNKYIKIDGKDLNLAYRLYIHDSRKGDLQKILNFWSKKVSIKSNQIKVSWKHNIVTKQRENKDYVGQFEVRVREITHFTSKILAISDIILTEYTRS